jgi:hypothetical protein
MIVMVLDLNVYDIVYGWKKSYYRTPATIHTHLFSPPLLVDRLRSITMSNKRNTIFFCDFE